MIKLTDAEILDRAADVMEKKGWNSGERHRYDGTVCVLGALEDALEVDSQSYSASVSFDNHSILPLLVKEIRLDSTIMPSFALASWSNNADGPTVINWLRKIAGRLRNAVTI